MIKVVTESDYRGELNPKKMESTVRSYVMRSTKVKKVMQSLHERPLSQAGICVGFTHRIVD